MHHSIDFLTNSDSKKLKHWMDDNNIDVVFSGHTYRVAIETYSDTYREIKQITSGAIVIDNYSLPSFYICEYDNETSKIQLQFYTYTSEKEDWVIDNRSIRNYKNGIHSFNLPRKNHDEKLNNVDITIIDYFDKKYEKKYKSRKIYSN